MFGKIKDKLKNLFNKNEELIEENFDEVIEVPQEEIVKEKKVETQTGHKNEVSREPKKEVKPKVEKPKPAPKLKLESKIKEEKIDEVLKDEVAKEEYVEPQKEFEVATKTFQPHIEKSNEEIEEDSQIEEEIIEEPVEEKKGFFGKLFGKKKEEELPVEEELTEIEPQVEEEVEEKKEDTGIFARLKAKKITDEDFDKIWIELEIFLLEINIAYEIVEKIESKLKQELIGNSFDRFKLTQKIQEVMAKEVEKVLKLRQANFLDKLNEIKSQELPIKILVLGVNGTGKTTSIAKIVNYLQKNNFSVVVAAADTFRAAAIEQLDEHAKKLGFKLIQHKNGSDPAAVAFDAIEHAKAKKIDIVLIDTAGRMPNNSNLMTELQKVKRVSNSQLAIFVGDSISGNDLIDQIELFNKGVEIDGVILTKVDTDEKPGSIVTTAYAIEKPIYFLGIGQTYDDLIEFNAKEISQKLFNPDEE